MLVGGRVPASPPEDFEPVPFGRDPSAGGGRVEEPEVSWLATIPLGKNYLLLHLKFHLSCNVLAGFKVAAFIVFCKLASQFKLVVASKLTKTPLLLVATFLAGHSTEICESQLDVVPMAIDVDLLCRGFGVVHPKF